MLPRTDYRSRKRAGMKAYRTRQKARSAGIALVLSSWLAVTAATAQPSAPAEPSDSGGRPADLRPTIPAGEAAPRDNASNAADPSSICQMIESAAAANGLPVAFFARVIWQESRMKPQAVGPRTRNGQRAQGIAQFMPMTAAERRLWDPFDPVQALPKSAEFLRELRAQFGNLGLAAAAYNAGPQRIRDWLAGKRTLPSETEAYVRKITGHAAQEWARPRQQSATLTIPAEIPCVETAERVATAKPVTKPRPASNVGQTSPTSVWGVQLIGDRSEITALASYYQLQKKHQGILGGYLPVVIRTTLKGTAVPIWSRVRIDASSREVAQVLCSRLRTAGENCLVQRN